MYPSKLDAECERLSRILKAKDGMLKGPNVAIFRCKMHSDGLMALWRLWRAYKKATLRAHPSGQDTRQTADAKAEETQAGYYLSMLGVRAIYTVKAFCHREGMHSYIKAYFTC